MYCCFLYVQYLFVQMHIVCAFYVDTSRLESELALIENDVSIFVATATCVASLVRHV